MYAVNFSGGEQVKTLTIPILDHGSPSGEKRVRLTLQGTDIILNGIVPAH